jgi:TonB family protein
MDNYRIKGIVGTILFHALLLLALFLLGLSTPLPLPDEEGVEVNLGYSEEGMGLIQPDQTAAPAEASPAEPAVSEEEEFVTDDQEEAMAVKPASKPKTTESKPRPQETTNANTSEVKPVPPTPKADPKAMYPGKTGSGQGGYQGTTGKPGDQGKPDGDPNASGYDGFGGSGSGISFSLSGRNADLLPKPPSSFKESGTVVVSIWVDREGKVVKAIPGARGTTTASSELSRLAKDAAMKAKFNAKPDAPEEQKGTITYHFLLKN